MKVKIGKEEYTLKYSNKVIWDIEEHFGEPIFNTLLRGDKLTRKELGYLIHFGVRDELSFDDFADNMELNQYAAAEIQIVEALKVAFGLDKKKV